MNSTASFISTASLESKLRQLKQQSLAIREHLTSSLSTSASGQILLQLAKTLDSNHLVPDTYEVIVNECLIPMRDNVKDFNKNYGQEWAELFDMVMDLRIKARRYNTVRLAREKFVELEAAEKIVKQIPASLKDINNSSNIEDLCMSVERVAFISLDLSEELKRCTTVATTYVQKRSSETKQGNLKVKVSVSLPLNLLKEPLPPNNERAQFFMKLASRIRRLESDLSQSLINIFSNLLKLIENEKYTIEESNSLDIKNNMLFDSVGHCLRSFAIIGRGKDAESTFARVSIMPLIRSKLSVGRIDQGGPRGHCSGLFSLLDDITCTILSRYGSLIHAASELFYTGINTPDIDLVVGGIWVPFATALMGEASIKMTIFSPGVTNVIQANFIALDAFVSRLADRLLIKTKTSLFLSLDLINEAQLRIMFHPITTEFNKKWNLPIYYQLRFGEISKRLDEAISKVETEGWHSAVLTCGKDAEDLIIKIGFKLPFFVEFYDILSSFWKQDIFLRPLSHRFLRGVLQFLNKIINIIKSGLDRGYKNMNHGSNENGHTLSATFYSWPDRVDDIASIIWDLNTLQSVLNDEYVEYVLSMVVPRNEGRRIFFNSDEDMKELSLCVHDILQQASNDIIPLIESGWELVVSLITKRCLAPLIAVKGVAATYRMTNRPSPTLASPYVLSVLRPLSEFILEFHDKIPSIIGSEWKSVVVNKVANKFCIAVQDLITTVKQTEEALRKRKSKRSNAQGMSDGEKVMLQIRLDIKDFKNCVVELGVNTIVIEDIARMEQLSDHAFD